MKKKFSKSSQMFEFKMFIRHSQILLQRSAGVSLKEKGLERLGEFWSSGRLIIMLKLLTASQWLAWVYLASVIDMLKKKINVGVFSWKRKLAMTA